MNNVQCPSDVRVKVENLRLRRDERQAALNSVYANIRDCEARCMRYENLVRAAGSEQARAEYAAKLQAGREDHERLVARHNAVNTEMRSAANDCARVEDWLARLGVSTRLRVLPKRTTTRNPENLAAVRDDIAKEQAEKARIQNCPLDRESQKANRAQQFDAVLAGFFVEERPYVTTLATRTTTVRPLTNLECVWWAFPEKRDELLNRLVPDAPDGMTTAAKAEALERVDSRLLTLELLEEALVEAEEASGSFVQRRPDASVLAILSIWVQWQASRLAAA